MLRATDSAQKRPQTYRRRPVSSTTAGPKPSPPIAAAPTRLPSLAQNLALQLPPPLPSSICGGAAVELPGDLVFFLEEFTFFFFFLSIMEASDAELINTEKTPPVRRHRKKKSMVWEHFTVETVSEGCIRACCKLCKQTFAYSNGSKVAGTSHLKRHISMGSCPKIKSLEKQQLALTPGAKSDVDTTDPPKKRYRTSSFGYGFDQEQSYTFLAKMIILNEYPLDMVEQPAFVLFIQSIQPRFRMVDANALEGEILSVYHKERLHLMQVFGNMSGRVGLTVGLWTTSQTLGYICLTGHYIDSDWKLQKKMLNFMMVVSPHSEMALSEAISVSLSEWNMKTKLFAITVTNNSLSHEIYSASLRDHLSKKHKVVLRGQLFVVRCYANILNLAAEVLTASIHGIIYNIRESVKFVKASPVRDEKFSEIALRIGLSGTKALSLDVRTLWNTTYLMLDAALEYKDAFTSLDACDDNYNEAPSADDWKKVEVVCTYLKLLHDSANNVMGTPERTANIFFPEAYKILLELTNGTSSEDPLVSSTAKQMHEMFDEYWRDCSLVLAIAVVMDPRFKLKLVEFSYSKLYGDDSTRYVKIVNDSVHELYLEYVSQSLPLVPYVDQGDDNHMNGIGSNLSSSPNVTGYGLMDFDIYLSETAVNESTKSELDQYLEESLVPRTHVFDILNWWKLNNIKYPTLSKMARDVLAIPVSSPECSFFGSGAGSRELDEYRSSLRPETVEALSCAKDWLQYSPITIEQPSTAIVKMEL
ncbi:zinc finger BED domain-containing protein RICESLEEPER 2-like isoform X1 [Zingiber officinale]|uniref:BED-type domain-containing protein n=2 Tax=Zingiber officinale TaxID=94328 RepID=A0A8J5KQI5_ZINOF|nr:zinc finger BED domain-containing protein RICESLEEPER 2-like isoform X1 [Zingiber officinale]XP_042402865.1 zinc finger BED domain-containing protein RICESLEEPER 2-like isoform X1 [Zingiber officinale]XP_042402866.1 zinc finger BED domain-containing protein RICESLEEPER 2-like isoform X1 [Zingiber officinale]KAG6495743.1 hypothetical protein ZIOFF_043570 [Zingiber officinale]